MLGRSTCGGAFITILRTRVRTADPILKQLARQREWTALSPLGTLFACRIASAFTLFGEPEPWPANRFTSRGSSRGRARRPGAKPGPGHIGQTWMEPELFLNMARTLERACFDYILLEDSSYVGESFGGSTEIYLKNAIAVPRQDPVRGGGADDPGDIAHRHRSDFRNIRLSPLPAGPPGGDARPGVGRAHRLERRHRQLGLCGYEFRHAGHARPRPALRHGRRIHGSVPRPVGLVGAGRDHRRPQVGRAGRSTPRSMPSITRASISARADRSTRGRRRRASR